MKEIEILQSLINEFRDTLGRLSTLIPREAAFPKAENKIKVAIGMRRSGKTYFIYQQILVLLAEGIPLSRILYLNFEDDRLLPMDAKKLADLIEAFFTLHPENHDQRCYLFLDEIQNVSDWSNVVRRFYDTRNVEIFLTGSSAKLLSKEIATSLRGRSLATEIWPYNFDEYMQAKNVSIDKSVFGKKIQDQLSVLFLEYLIEGGFPEVVNYAADVRQRTLQDYVDIVIYRDIIERHQISNTALIKYMIMTMIHNIAKPFTINKFFNDLKSQGYKISKNDLYDYSDYIEDAYLAFSVPLYTKSIRKQQTNPKKVYAIDTGLVKALTLEPQSDMGRIFENLIYLDLRRKDYIIHYYLTAERYEVDFLIQDRQGRKKLLQVTWDMSDVETMQRETRALEIAMKELKVPGEMITLKDYLQTGIPDL